MKVVNSKRKASNFFNKGLEQTNENKEKTLHGSREVSSFSEASGNPERTIYMSIVIIGGNERMVCQYTDICKDYGYKAKVFPKENGAIRKKIGCPDLMVLFTNTVSHKMVISASQEAKKNNIPVARVHTSSASALKCALDEHCVMA